MKIVRWGDGITIYTEGNIIDIYDGRIVSTVGFDLNTLPRLFLVLYSSM